MISFFTALFILVAGYFIYGKIVEKIFAPKDDPTPAIKNPDGVDYVPVSTPKAFLIQFLNIAGLGPIFGAISGALWGPSVYLWIVSGTLLAGGVHDFMSGMLSERNDGASISEVTGKYLGPVMHNVMRIFSVILLLFVGVAFTAGPAQLLNELVPSVSVRLWIVIIIVYYFCATLLPIDKLIGRFYPVFGILLLLMAIGVGISTIINSGSRPLMELTLENLYPAADGGQKPIWPLMFITVACGAISGFHSTQSPIVSRCIKSERQGRRIFYGAMVAEGIVALIWAAAAIAFFWNKDGTSGLSSLLKLGGGGSKSVALMCRGLLPAVFATVAIMGVIICPITSGDTAFRAARMTIFDWFKLDEKKISIRLAVAVPLLFVGWAITNIDYQIIWRYFSWSNQTLAMIVLWACSVYLATNYGSNPNRCWLTVIPAAFMTAVSITYLMYAPECLNFGAKGETGVLISYIVGVAAALVLLAVFIFTTFIHAEKSLEKQSKIFIGRNLTESNNGGKNSKKVVLITGASSGIGLETALKLIEKGFTVYGAARRVEQMEAIKAAGGNTVFLDFYDESSISNAVSEVIEKEGRIDVLINNAGFGYGGSIESVTVENAKKQFDVNVFGLTEITQKVLPFMRSQKSGRIINISSIAGKFSSPFMGWYHASKYCVEALSDSLRLEVRPFGIKVSIVEPGLIQTDWGKIAAENLRKSTEGTDYEKDGKLVAGFYEKNYCNEKRRITPASKVADTIIKAVTADSPKIRYHVGKYSVLFPLAARFLNSRLFDFISRKFFGL